MMAASVGAVLTINNTQYLYPFYLFNHFFFILKLFYLFLFSQEEEETFEHVFQMYPFLSRLLYSTIV